VTHLQPSVSLCRSSYTRNPLYFGAAFTIATDTPWCPFVHDENIRYQEVRARAMQFRVQHKSKQLPLPEGLETSVKTPPRARLPPPIVKTASVSFQDAIDTAPDTHFASTPSVDIAVDPDHKESPDTVVDSSIYDCPWSPTANSAAYLVHPLDTSITCPFKYRSLQDLLTSTAIQQHVSVCSLVQIQNYGGANCFIFHDSAVFWNLHHTPLSVKQLDGSTVPSKGYGVVIIQPINSLHLLALWPSYYYPNAPQRTFSPNAIAHYLLLPSGITSHASHLNITFPSAVILHFPSLLSII
jgi:hypothetical protein